MIVFGSFSSVNNQCRTLTTFGLVNTKRTYLLLLDLSLSAIKNNCSFINDTKLIDFLSQEIYSEIQYETAYQDSQN